MIHVLIDSLRYSLLTHHLLAVLKEASGERCLTVWLPQSESAMLISKLRKEKHPRPLTYDFFVRALHQTNLSVERVVFHEVVDGQARVQVIVARRGALNRQRIPVNCNAVDALLTATHFDVPIYAAPEVLAQIGTTLDSLPTKAMDDAAWSVKVNAPDAAAQETGA